MAGNTAQKPKITLGKSVILDSSDLLKAEERVRTLVRGFLNEWRTESVAGMSRASWPKDPDAAPEWLKTLAGDLTWGLTLLGPEIAVIAAGIEVGQKVYGSVSTYLEANGITIVRSAGTEFEKIKGYIDTGFAELVDRTEKTIRTEFVKEWAMELAQLTQRDPGNLDAQEQLIWKHMFPELTDFDTRRKDMNQQTMQVIEAAISAFTTQYQTWQGALENCRNENSYSVSVGGFSGGTTARILNPGAEELCQAANPFNPALYHSRPLQTGQFNYAGIWQLWRRIASAK